VSDFVYFAISTVSLGSLYAVMALGLVIVYGILRLVNFAYGTLIMIAGYTLYLIQSSSLPWLAMGILAVCAAIGGSVLTERIAFRPIRNKSLTAMLVTSFAVMVIFKNAAVVFISPRARVVPVPSLFEETIQIVGNQIPIRDLLAIGVSITLLVGFTLLLNRTVLGIALRAAAQNLTMTRMLGIPANTVIGLAFAISGLMAGIVALFWLGRTGSVTPSIGLQPLIIAFIATVLGGMRSLVGAVVGGYILALITVSANTFLPQTILDFRQAVIFGFVIVILLVRPQGLVGKN